MASKRARQRDNTKNEIDVSSIASKARIPADIIKIDDTKKRKSLGTKEVESQLQKLTSKSNEARAIMEALPDLYLVRDTIVASILNPRDFISSEVELRLKRIEGLSEDTQGALLKIFNEYFLDVVKLNDRLPKMISDSLVVDGSYSLLTLPQRLMNDIIRAPEIAGIESLTPHLDKYRTDCFDYVKPKQLEKMGISIEDNPRVLGGPEMRKRISEHDAALKYGIESIESSTLSLRNPEGLEKDEKDIEEASIYPLLLNIPHDAVIPIHVPNDPSEQYGFCLLVNEQGYVVSRVKDGNHVEKIKNLNSNLSEATKLAAKQLGLDSLDKDKTLSIKSLTDEYINVIEKELRDALKNGKVGSHIEVSRPMEVYHLMLARSLSKMKTKLVYVDRSLMSYMAYDYTPEGYGESLIEKTKLYSSFRIITLFTRLRSYVINSVAGTQLEITLDPDDQDHVKTVHEVSNEFINMSSDGFPVGQFYAEDVFHSLARSSVQVKVDGGDAFPGTKTEISDQRRDAVVPDTDLDDILRKTQYNAFGVPPEAIDRALEGDFATSITYSNKISAKRFKGWQKITEEQWLEWICSHTRANRRLQQDLVNACAADEKEKFNLATFLGAVTFKLPEPDNSKLESEADAIATKASSVDEAVEFFINAESLGGLVKGEHLPDVIDSLRVALKNMVMRDWMRSQNIMTEMEDILTNKEIPFSERLKSHHSSLSDEFATIIKDMMDIKVKTDDTINKHAGKTGAGSSDNQESDSGSGGSTWSF